MMMMMMITKYKKLHLTMPPTGSESSSQAVNSFSFVAFIKYSVACCDQSAVAVPPEAVTGQSAVSVSPAPVTGATLAKWQQMANGGTFESPSGSCRRLETATHSLPPKSMLRTCTSHSYNTGLPLSDNNDNLS